MDTALRSDPLSQQEAKIWKISSEKTPTGPLLTRSVAKITVIIFWGCGGILLDGFLPHGTTINGPYDASLLHRLFSLIREKHRSGVMLFHLFKD